MTLVRKQLFGMLGAAAAFAAVYLVWLEAPRIFASVPLPGDDLGARLAFAANWLLVPGLTLLIGIVGASRRGFFADAIDGTRTPQSYGLEINLRYNTNTVEQTVLAAIAWSGLAINLPRSQLIFIPAAALMFGVGRATFWIGYRVYPMARAFGMVSTVTPTLIAYAWLVSRAI